MNIAGKGDLGYWFRMQDPRSMDQVDDLLARKEQLAKSVGEEKALEIRNCPELFADAEKFRIFHAKARFRATFTSIGAFMVGSSVAAPMLGLENGSQLIRRYGMLAVPAFVGTWVVTY